MSAADNSVVDGWSTAGAVFGAGAFYFQAVKVFRSQTHYGLSLVSFSTLLVSLLLYTVYFCMADDPFAAVLSVVQALPLLYIVYMCRSIEMRANPEEK